MKKMTKMLLAAGGAALICGGSVMTYLKAQTQQLEMSTLTLTNIELLAAAPCNDRFDIVGPVITVTVCNRTTSWLDVIRHVECGTDSTGACTFDNIK